MLLNRDQFLVSFTSLFMPVFLIQFIYNVRHCLRVSFQIFFISRLRNKNAVKDDAKISSTVDHKPQIVHILNFDKNNSPREEPSDKRLDGDERG